MSLRRIAPLLVFAIGLLALLLPSTAAAAAPTCAPLTITATHGAYTNFLLDCTDADNDALTYTVTADPALGSATFVGGGNGFYNSTGANGADSFDVDVDDGVDGPTSVTVNVTVQDRVYCFGDSTMAIRPTQTRNADTCYSSLDSYQDITYTVGSSSAPAVATAAIVDGLPVVHALTEGTATIRVNAHGATTNTDAHYDLEVTVDAAANAAPTCYQVSNGTNGIALRTNASASRSYYCEDVDGDTVSVTMDAATLGTASLVPGAGDTDPRIDYAAHGVPGTETLHLHADDGHVGGTYDFDVDVEVFDNATNSAPVCEPLAFGPHELSSGHGAQDIPLNSRCHDAEGDAITYTVVTEPVHITGSSAIVIAGSDVSFRYTPAPGFDGTDAVTLKASDGRAGGDTQFTDAIEVINGGPSCPASYPIQVRTGFTYGAFPCDGYIPITLAATPGNDPAIATVTVNDGEVLVDGVSAGTTSVNLVADDGNGNHFTLTAPITVAATANHAPTCYVSLTTVRASSSRPATLSCSDAENDAISAVKDGAHPPTLGTLGTLPALQHDSDRGDWSATATYTAGAATGYDSLQFTATDDFAANAMSAHVDDQVHVIAANANTAPTCDPFPADAYSNEGEQWVYGDCWDMEDDAIVYSIVAPPAAGTLTVSGDHFLYTPPANFSGTATFTYRATDELNAQSAVTTKTVHVLVGVPDDNTAPVATINSGPTGTTSSTSASFTFSSNEAGSSFICWLGSNEASHVACDSGSFTMPGAPLANGSYTFNVKAIDSAMNISSAATRSWTVNTASTVQVSTTVPAGGTTSSGAASAASPIVVSLTSPNGGTVSVDKVASPQTTAPTGYTLLGQELVIEAPAASAGAPLRFVFTLDASVIPAGTDRNTLTVLRDGAAITASCAGETAVPSPCVRQREVLTDGGLRLTILADHASRWVFGQSKAETPVPPVTPAAKATKLTSVTSQVVKYKCTKKEAKNGVLVKKVRWCFKLVVSAKLVDSAAGTPVAGQVVSFTTSKKLAVGKVATNAKGVASVTKPIIVPVKSRKSLGTATKWLASQFIKSTAHHVLSGTAFTAAADVTVNTKR